MKIGIIGGGAAGIIASISASECGAEAVILERTESVLNKFVLSGGGRCNISNENILPDYYNGGSRHFIANVLKSFGKAEMLSFLKRLTIKYIVEREGKIYTGDSQKTAHLLINHTVSLGTKIRYKAFAEKIVRESDGFRVVYKGKDEFFQRLIIATGGKSYPETGSDGFGYALAESLGHTIVHPLPGLTSLNLRPNPFSGLHGITVDSEIILQNKRLKVSEKERGKLLFTHKGISGPSVHNISGRYIRISRERGTFVFINFLPDAVKDECIRVIQSAVATGGKKKVINFLTGYLPDRLAMRIMSVSEIPQGRILAELKRDERIRLIKNLTEFNVNISDSPGFWAAHITTGGVSLDEVNPSTMESRIVKGLF
ncbi:MAG: aminoacetone oxidase family FAD-binding enzyme, partial [Deltaproteobacteria bacterium]|nr:aminoacetone oxidase family FAD-binding enzyme [Deltaproteobacteria bacterium]